MAKRKPPVILNLGCGQAKIDGTVNIDTEKSCKPDIVCDFSCEKLPFRSNSVDEVLFFHTIEHIRKRFHPWILSEVNRVLKVGGVFYCSFPEFLKCVRMWEKNANGDRQFWENTIFGRQLYPSDHHVCIMDSREFEQRLINHGFGNIETKSEPHQLFNTMFLATKVSTSITYEQIIAEDQASVKVVTSRDKGRTKTHRSK